MALKVFEFTPFKIEFSFRKLEQELSLYLTKDDINIFKKDYYQDLLRRAHLILGEDLTVDEVGFENEEKQKVIKELFDEVFPFALTDNEIKAVSMPFQNITYNHTNRFKQIIADAKELYTGEIRDFRQHDYYISCCCIIMNYYFKANFDLTRPLFIDLPDNRGIIRHYRVLYNADFVEIIPTDKAVMLTQKDIELLQDNYDNLELWQSYFPQESWELNGFGLLSLVDVTFENALSLLKENFLQSELTRQPLGTFVNQLFSSIFKIPNLRAGFTLLVNNKNAPIDFKSIMTIKSHLTDDTNGKMVISAKAYRQLVQKRKYYSISDIDKEIEDPEEMEMCLNLRRHGVRSCLFSPVVIPDGVEGIFEITSQNTRDLHSVNAEKLNALMPIINETIKRIQSDVINSIEAIIQREYTTIHPSVYWKFLDEAVVNYMSINKTNSLVNPIVFNDVFPLYGEIDIKGSSQLRNNSIQQDLVLQLQSILSLLTENSKNIDGIVLEKHRLKITSLIKQVEFNFYSGLEQRVENYVKREIHSLLRNDNYRFDALKLKDYFEYIDYEKDIYYKNRKIFDSQVARVNQCFSDILDQRQQIAQDFFPHYYERFKTDGVEHNLYIGSTICPDKVFDNTYLQYLRLWQLQVIIEQMCVHYRNNSQDELVMDVTSLIFVFDTSITIRFRMDEKKFDIDGAYDTRFEIIKKRLDKALVKNHTERIVQSKSITIVFASSIDREDYMAYIEYFQTKGMLKKDVQQFEVSDLQGVVGLLALRVEVDLSFNVETIDYTHIMDNFLRGRYV